MAEVKDGGPAIEVWRHPSGAYQLCTDYGGVGHRLGGPKFGGVSVRLRRFEIDERGCDELEKFVAETRAALLRAREVKS